MADMQPRKTQSAAIIVIITLLVLITLLVILAFRFISVTVIEPTITEPETETGYAYVPVPEPPDEYIPEPPDETDTREEVRLEMEDFIDNITVQGNSIYYSHSGWDIITVVRVSADGTEEQKTEIEWDSWGPWISTFEVTSDGYFLFLLHEFEEDGEVYYFARYNVAQSTMIYQNISDQLSIDMNTTWIHTAAFDADGNIFIHIPDEDKIYILDRDGIYSGQIDLDDFWVADAFQARDGQVILLGRDETFDLVLKGIDLETNTLTNITTFPSHLMWLWGAYSGHNSTRFDLYIDFEYNDIEGLYGYNIQTGELTFLFDWEEIGILPDWDNDIVFLENGQVAVLQRHSTRNRFWAELIIFTP